MARRVDRRDWLRRCAVAGVGAFGAPAFLASSRRSPNERLDIAVVGVGGRGAANLNGCRAENIVALCDVDDKRAAKGYERFPKARRFHDFRRMYDALGDKFDAVVISTPDHTHYHPAAAAMQLGKHCYLEKPMAHSVDEVRRLTQLARENKVATQLGVQRHTIGNVHRVVELVKSGAIGPVKEVHCWVTGRRGMPGMPTDTPPVPSTLKWDLWLGPARERPYHSTYAPYGWRFWWDFGTGETGNWGCHILDIPYWALDLDAPTRVDASGPPVHGQMTPRGMSVRYRFPKRGGRDPITLHWHHFQSPPEALQAKGYPLGGMNTLFVGESGDLLCGFGKHKLYPEDKFEEHRAPPRSIPKSPGFHKEWLEACKGRGTPTCRFDYSGPLTETVLLGNVAYRAGGGFAWDATNLRASTPEAQALIAEEYRKGW